MLRLFLLFMICLSFAFPGPVHAVDMRADHLELEKEKKALLEKAQREEREAKKESRDSRKEILKDRESLLKAVAELEKKNKGLVEEIDLLEKSVLSLEEQEVELKESLSESEAVNRELSGFVRSSAKDLDALLNQSPQSGLGEARGDFLKPMVEEKRFPSMDDIRKMVGLLFDEIGKSGEVTLVKGPIVDRQGRETRGDILLLGNFTAIYSIGNETGFLIYSDQSRRHFALSKLPRNRMVKNMREYMSGGRDDVYLDISRGGALRQLTHELSLLEQIPKGGPIVWPILGLLGLGFLIVLERVVFLLFKHMNVDSLMVKVSDMVGAGRWEDCKSLLTKKRRKFVPKVLLTALDFKDQGREDMENALQEAILGEIPRLERFLSTLGMLAAIAPLLGLLGTVTGMINTFHVITYYGTGDPRMMSGGISEALVTTMLGLSVAIPIMLAHTLLNRKVEKEIGLMEEKAVSFVNMVFKARNGS